MPDTQTTETGKVAVKPLNLSINLSKIAVGTFAPMGGMPVDFAKARILDRAGVPRLMKCADGSTAPHPLRAGLVHTHGGTTDKNAVRLPEVFPPAGYDGPLDSAQDWMTLIDQSAVRPTHVVAESVVVADQSHTAEDRVADQEHLADQDIVAEDENPAS